MCMHMCGVVQSPVGKVCVGGNEAQAHSLRVALLRSSFPSYVDTSALKTVIKMCRRRESWSDAQMEMVIRSL